MKRFLKILFLYLITVLVALSSGCGADVPAVTLTIDQAPVAKDAVCIINVDQTVQVGFSLERGGATAEYTVNEAEQPVISVDGSGAVTGIAKGSAALLVRIMPDDGKPQNLEIAFEVVENRKCVVTAVIEMTLYKDYKMYSETVEYGTQVTFLPQKDTQAYTFLGWTKEYGSGECITAIESIKEDVTLYAEFRVNVYRIVYELQGGEWDKDVGDLEYVDVAYGSELTPPVPKREGYRFLGWGWKEESNYVFDSLSVRRSETLYAQWEAVGENRNAN